MKNQTKHTPGPWYIDETFGLIMWQDKEVAAIHAARNGDAKGNAALIAAAPEMLEALEACQRAIGAGIDADPELWKAAYIKTELAITKAKGGA